ncbi:MAG: hypothetical protein E7677_04705 [Ruminococcaceae bacterium]|nr:hypothetical protein [Oscillospiraceae bacterium]
MKRIICVFLCIIFCASVFIPSAFATETVDTESEMSADAFLGAVTFSCILDAENNQVLISGTVRHDFMISHPDYEIHIYSAAPSEDVQKAVTADGVLPLAKTSMSVRFTFYIEIESAVDRFSNYAVVLSSPEGENFLAAEPLMPAVASTYQDVADDRSHFKGIYTDSGISIIDKGIGTAVIDVDFNLLKGDAADSIVHTVKNSSYLIRSSYVDKLDSAILSASLNRCNIYLRFLYHSDVDATKCAIPSLYAYEELEYVYAVAEFLANRYVQDKGSIAGIVVGMSADDIETVNYIGNLSVDEYCDLYAFYVSVLASAVRQATPSADVVIPVSDKNDYTYDGYGDLALSPSKLLNNVISALDRSFSQEFNCSVMIESKSVPFGIDGKMLADGIDTENIDDSRIGAYNVSAFLGYLNSLRASHESAPVSVMYSWHADGALEGNALSCAYVYNYLKLLQSKEISCFVLQTDKNSQDNDISTLIKLIDTPNAAEQMNSLLEYFKEDSWNDVLSENVSIPSFGKIWSKTFYEEKPQNIKGSFAYMDFAVASDFNSIVTGENCSSVLSDQDSDEFRALRAVSMPLEIGQSTQIIGRLKYPESYSYTSVMSITIEAEDTSASDDALYEVTLTVGEQKNRLVAKGILKNGARTELYFDVSDYAQENLAEYLTVSVKNLTEKSSSLSVWVHDVKGFSTEYSTEELETLISAKRQELRNLDETDDSGFDYKIILIIIGVTFAAFALGVVLMILFRRDDTSKKE